MIGSGDGTDRSASRLERVGARLATADRGWKATLLGVVVVLLVAVGL